MKKHMKKWISLIAAVGMAFSLAACGSGSTAAPASSAAETQAPETEAAEMDSAETAIAESESAVGVQESEEIPEASDIEESVVEDESGSEEQTLTHTFDFEGLKAVVTLDLRDGWSADFGSGAVYFWGPDDDKNNEASAYGYVISKDEYDENVAEYKNYDSFTEVDGGVKFNEGEGGCYKYLFQVDEDVYFMIAVRQDLDPEPVYARFDVKKYDAASDSSSDASSGTSSKKGIDYLALVNKLNPLPDGWEDSLETVTMTNTVGDEVEVEKKAYDAYLKLKEALEAEGVFVDLDSARRSVAKQQEIMDRFTEEYGADYAAKTVAVPGFSEHHTGLALDLYLIIDGQDVTQNEDMIQYPEIWEKIHAKLADYGFILRYLKDKEHITGYGYEPWHIRYIDDVEKAQEIMSKGITLEGFLGAVNETDVDIDYGSSTAYSQEELEEAVIQIKCKFASFEGCELHSLRYAGDECRTQENVEWLNSLSEGSNYTQVCEFLSSFHTPAEGDFAWEPDHEYEDYQWWLARTDDGGWEVVSWGY